MKDMRIILFCLIPLYWFEDNQFMRDYKIWNKWRSCYLALVNHRFEFIACFFEERSSDLGACILWHIHGKIKLKEGIAWKSNNIIFYLPPVRSNHKNKITKQIERFPYLVIFSLSLSLTLSLTLSVPLSLSLLLSLFFSLSLSPALSLSPSLFLSAWRHSKLSHHNLPEESTRSIEKRWPSPLAFDHFLIWLLLVTRALIVHLLKQTKRRSKSKSKTKNKEKRN